ncbi:Holliday junction branch migration protein RuvA [Tsukamurella asaccharolytica]|uniref:Holliday junction branch migration complex subunit RuvA n=1 Tax=Tsukamurella asaccharolytica TaxID=2592067 RepID=A0A5C5RBC2_9ACTN|nr:Holliday junction branch migration protein RuvA [Tsukamurella asaccharolytica]TWS20068.1 Holliday junction branch migration protein RuvA [Tsukamurella asaccharolytica]
MIASLRGEVRHIGLDHVVVECAGVGYRVLVAPNTAGTLTRGSEGFLLTSMVVREDSQTLYGFTDGPQQDLFHLLQTVQGVGPRLAMAAIAVLEPAQMQVAIASGDITTLCLIPGVGKRVAERIHVELKDKVSAASSNGSASAGSTVPADGVSEQLLNALEGLGFTPKQAEPAVAAAVEAGAGKSVSELLRDALKSLGRG